MSELKEYKVYFSLGHHKLKMNVMAHSKEEAKIYVMGKIVWHDIKDVEQTGPKSYGPLDILEDMLNNMK